MTRAFVMLALVALTEVVLAYYTRIDLEVNGLILRDGTQELQVHGGAGPQAPPEAEIMADLRRPFGRAYRIALPDGGVVGCRHVAVWLSCDAPWQAERI